MTMLLRIVEVGATYLEFWVFYSILDYFTKHKYKDEKHGIYKCVLVLFLTICIQLCNFLALFSCFTLVVAIILITLSSSLLYKDKISKYMYLGSIYFFLIYILDFLTIILLSKITNNLQFGKEIISYLSVKRMIYIIFLKIMLVVLYLLFIRIYRKYKIKLKYIKPLFAISIIGFICIFYMDEQTFNQISSQVINNWIRLLIVFLLIAFLVLLIYKIQNDNFEMKAIELHNKILESDYKHLKKIYNEDVKLFHDFHNHLNLIFHLLEGGHVEDVKDYILKLDSFSKMSNKLIYSGNEIIDIILNTKTVYARENSIDVAINVGVENVLPIKSVDLCVIISNLYDNAIEATLKIEDKTERKISISIGIINKMMILKFVNTYKRDSLNKTHFFSTSKGDFRHHGLGIKSVENAVDKYNGYVDYNVKDEYVKATVMLPLEQSSNTY